MPLPIEVVGRITPANLEAILAHLEDVVRPHLTPDVSNYAKGRERVWLEHEWDLRKKTFSPGLHDERLWTWICNWMQKNAGWVPDLGLVTYGPVGIKLHRDDSYADYRAGAMNLGVIEGWHYKGGYEGWGYGPQTGTEEVVLALEPGDVVQFNCKNQHAVINPSEDRWAISLWSVSRKFRAQFNNYKEEK